jgi:hypothetical protein
MRLALNGEDGGLAAYLNGHHVVDFAAAKQRLRPPQPGSVSSPRARRTINPEPVQQIELER